MQLAALPQPPAAFCCAGSLQVSFYSKSRTHMNPFRTHDTDVVFAKRGGVAPPQPTTFFLFFFTPCKLAAKNIAPSHPTGSLLANREFRPLQPPRFFKLCKIASSAILPAKAERIWTPSQSVIKTLCLQMGRPAPLFFFTPCRLAFKSILPSTKPCLKHILLTELSKAITLAFCLNYTSEDPNSNKPIKMLREFRTNTQTRNDNTLYRTETTV